MFDLTSGTIERPFRDTRTVPGILAIAAHVVVVGAVIGTTLFVMTEGLPEVPTIMAFVTAMPAPPPPPPPPPPPAAGPKPAQRPEPLPTSGRAAPPVQAPIGISVETGSQAGVEGGVPGGVEGGTPGGVLGGVVGGIIADVPPPPPPPAPQTPVRIGGQVQAPELVHRVEPVYPDIAAKGRVKGLVILEATVNEQGEVVNVVVLRSITLLDQAAIDAVKQWRYRPLLLNGSARSFVLTVTLNFSIG